METNYSELLEEQGKQAMMDAQGLETYLNFGFDEFEAFRLLMEEPEKPKLSDDKLLASFN